MEVLCFSPARSPILHPKFTSKEAVKSSNSFAAVRRSSLRLKSLIYPKVSKSLIASISSAAEGDNKLPEHSYEELKYEIGKLIPNNDLGDPNIKLDPVKYLSEILLSRVYDVANEAPFQEAALLYKKDEEDVRYFVKRDDKQPVFSFKLRGAYNMMSKLPDTELKQGVITASAGNHAQGVALSAQKLGCDATVVMPIHTPDIKIQAVKRLGGTIELYGESFNEAQEWALKRAEEEKLVYIPPFDHQEIIVGQGTVGMEIVREMKEEPYAIFVPIGGGGLVSGISSYCKAILPNVKIIGVEPTGACGMALSFQLGERVGLESTNTIADGVAVTVVGKETYEVCRKLVDGVVVVNDEHIAAAIKDVFNESRTILEPSGALALAGAKAYCNYESQKDLVKGKSIVAVSSGSNMDFEKLKDIVDMADIGNQREAILASYLPEQPGSFKRFCELVGSLNITEFKYRYDSSKEKALLQYSVAYRSKAELDTLVERLKAAQLQTVNVSDQQLVLRHLRHLVGGQSKVDNEILCRVKLPDKPGAFLKFLNALHPSWNISLVHHRIEGSIDANVLVGLQVAESEIREFHERAKSIGYPYKVHSKHESLLHLIG